MNHALTIDAGRHSTWVERCGEQGLPADGAPREIRIRLAPDSRRRIVRQSRYPSSPSA